MNDKIFSYIRHHTLTVVTIIVAGFLLLAGGEYFLYRKIMVLNKMLAEGIIQIKSELKPSDISPTAVSIEK